MPCRDHKKAAIWLPFCGPKGPFIRGSAPNVPRGLFAFPYFLASLKNTRLGRAAGAAFVAPLLYSSTHQQDFP